MPGDGHAPRRQARGEVETLPSGSLRVRVYAGVDPTSGKRHYLVETVPAGPRAAEDAERVRARLLREVRARRERAARTTAGPASTAPGSTAPGSTAPGSTSPGSTAPGRRRGALTVAAIARLAGVSPPTVSKVLNGRPGVAPETRRRVEELLRDQGYRRPERDARSACIEVVFYGTQSHVVVDVMRGVKDAVAERGLTVGFTDVLGEASAGRNWARALLARHPLGVISVHLGATPQEHALLRASRIPLVAVDPTSRPLQSAPSVSADNRGGAVVAAQHLADLGHRRIAVITGPLERLCAKDRLDGVRAVLDAVQAPPEEGLVRVGEWFSFAEGFDHARELLRLPQPPTAVLCGNDLQAFGVYEAARQAGVRIPHDLSVVGFDDLSYARWCGPPLTTVRQPFEQMGATAAGLVLALADGEDPLQTHIELAAALIVRESTAPPSRR